MSGPSGLDGGSSSYSLYALGARFCIDLVFFTNDFLCLHTFTALMFSQGRGSRQNLAQTHDISGDFLNPSKNTRCSFRCRILS